MKKQRFILSVAAALFTSCEKTPNVKPGSDKNEPQVSCDVVEITENINAPTTWHAGKVYVIKDRDITVNTVLTIEAGAIIKFKDAPPGYY